MDVANRTSSGSSRQGAGRPVVLYAALREPTYVRNLVALRALGHHGFKVVECTSQRRSYPLRIVEVLAKLAFAALTRRFDVVVLGFLAQPLVPLIRLMTRKPLVVDGFISLYDTLCFDRRKFRPTSPGGRLAHWLDRTAFRRADILVVDTEEHGAYLQEEFGVSPPRIRVIPVGADDRVFRPRPRLKSAARPSVFYYATALPVHGLANVVEAARLLIPKGVDFRIACPPDAAGGAPANVTLLGWISLTSLAQEMADADVVLAGHFSVVPKARRVVAGKTYQALACGRPTIVSDLPANRRVLEDGVTAYFCAAASPESIAGAVERVLAHPGTAALVGQQGRQAYEREWHIDVLTPLWAEAVRGATAPD